MAIFKFFSDTNYALFLSDLDLMEVPVDAQDSEMLTVEVDQGVVDGDSEITELATQLGGFVQEAK